MVFYLVLVVLERTTPELPHLCICVYENVIDGLVPDTHLTIVPRETLKRVWPIESNKYSHIDVCQCPIV
jgi:hypothetical protein